MKKLTIFMVVFMLFLTGSLLYIGLSIQNKNKDYIAFENDLIDIAKTYVTTDQIGVNIGGSEKLSLEQMINDLMLHSNKVNEDECSGYVTINRSLSGYEYKPYIKCSKYESIVD